MFDVPFKWMFDKPAEIAAFRRTSYSAAAKEIAAAWRKEKFASRDHIFPILAGLCVDSNPDLFDEIEILADAMIEHDPATADRIADLLEKMRATAVWGEVRHNHITKGRDRTALFLKLVG
ncbi:hypothetical protein [Sphingomonas sp. Leaf67]|uniref:hypothetical protein n=1 Tax=Sphingomonas sp. Leaf67 TaxID=1736230 RepID=UPI0012E241B8|nr:hypothetical protein [Sphingomonas sp. Leaf67]